MISNIKSILNGKSIIATALIGGALIFTQAKAQDSGEAVSSGKSIYLGAKAGVAVSQFSRTQPHISEKIGVTIGAFGEYALSDQFSVRLEANYLQQGGRLIRFSDNTRFGDNSELAVYTTDNDYTTHNVDVPLLAKYTFTSLGDLNLSLMAGPAVTLNLGATNNFERTYHSNQVFVTTRGYEDITSSFEQLHYAAVGGIGGELSTGSKSYLVDIRFRYGVTPAKKSFSYVELYDRIFIFIDQVFNEEA